MGALLKSFSYQNNMIICIREKYKCPMKTLAFTLLIRNFTFVGSNPWIVLLLLFLLISQPSGQGCKVTDSIFDSSVILPAS